MTTPVSLTRTPIERSRAEEVPPDMSPEMSPDMSPDVPPDADHVLEQLYDAHYVRLVRLSALLVADTGRAEEVVQDSFVALYERLDRLAGADLAAYLRTSVVNRSRSVLRRVRVATQHPPYAPLSEPGADDAVLRGVRRRAVVDALGQLPRRQREVLALRYYLDLSEKEIAATLGISTGAVKSHASRGAAALRARMSLEETP